MNDRPPLRPLTILIVDDDAGIVRALRRPLEKMGHRVIGAGCRAEAIELARTHKPDAAVVDLILGDEDGPDAEPTGLAVCRELCALPDGPFVVVLSGQPAHEVYAASLLAGAVLHLQKPVYADHLNACLQTHYDLLSGGSQRPPPPFPLQLNDKVRTASWRGKPLNLNPGEHQALGYLLNHCDRVISDAEMQTHLKSASEKAARKTVNRARRKLGADQKLVETVRNEGFMIRCPSRG